MQTDSYIIHETGFMDADIKAVFCGAAGANIALSEVIFPSKGDPKDYYKVLVKEKLSLMFHNPNEPKKTTEEQNIKYILGQLDMWNGSDKTGNAMAQRAAELIRALIEKNKEAK